MIAAQYEQIAIFQFLTAAFQWLKDPHRVSQKAFAKVTIHFFQTFHVFGSTREEKTRRKEGCRLRTEENRWDDRIEQPITFAPGAVDYNSLVSSFIARNLFPSRRRHDIIAHKQIAFVVDAYLPATYFRAVWLDSCIETSTSCTARLYDCHTVR